MKILKIGFNSEITKKLSEKANLLAWAIGGINYLGFDITRTAKIIIMIVCWSMLQYVSLAFLKVSLTLKKEEDHNKLKEN